MLKLRVVCENAHWIVVDKPPGFHTHPPENRELRINPRWNAQGILEKQLGLKIYPAHRLDRAASGLLLYSKVRETNAYLQKQFASRDVEKIYHVLIRGTISEPVRFENALPNESGSMLPAITEAVPSFSFSLPILHPRGGQRSFTLLEVRTHSGRFHQIRRHFAQAGSPLLGDSRHGDRKLNREFALLTGCKQLFLRCMRLGFRCPETEQWFCARAKWGREWHRIFDFAGACGLASVPAPPHTQTANE